MLKVGVKNEETSLVDTKANSNVINSREHTTIKTANLSQKNRLRASGDENIYQHLSKKLTQTTNDDETSNHDENDENEQIHAIGKLDLLARAAETIGCDDVTKRQINSDQKSMRTAKPKLKIAVSNSEEKSMSIETDTMPIRSASANDAMNNAFNLDEVKQMQDRLAKLSALMAANSNLSMLPSQLSMAAAAVAEQQLKLNSFALNYQLGTNNNESNRTSPTRPQTNSPMSHSQLIDTLSTGSQQDANSIDLTLLQTLLNGMKANSKNGLRPHLNETNINETGNQCQTYMASSMPHSLALNALDLDKSSQHMFKFNSTHVDTNSLSDRSSILQVTTPPASARVAAPGSPLSMSSATSSGTHNVVPMLIGKNGKPTRPFKAYPKEPLSVPLGCTPAISLSPSSVNHNTAVSPNQTMISSQLGLDMNSYADASLLNNQAVLAAAHMAIQTLLAQQQRQHHHHHQSQQPHITNQPNSLLSIENVLNVIAAITSTQANDMNASSTNEPVQAVSSVATGPSQPPDTSLYSPPISHTTATNLDTTSPQVLVEPLKKISSTNNDNVASIATNSSLSTDLTLSLINRGNTDFSQLDISSLSALTSSDFCTQYRKRIQQAQERLLQKKLKQQQEQQEQQKQQEQQPQYSTDKKRSSNNKRSQRSPASQTNMNCDTNSSKSNSPTRANVLNNNKTQSQQDINMFSHEGLVRLLVNNMQDLKHQATTNQSRSEPEPSLSASRSPDADHASSSPSPEASSDYMNYPPKKRLRIQQQQSQQNDSENPSQKPTPKPTGNMLDLLLELSNSAVAAANETKKASNHNIETSIEMDDQQRKSVESKASGSSSAHANQINNGSIIPKTSAALNLSSSSSSSSSSSGIGGCSTLLSSSSSSSSSSTTPPPAVSSSSTFLFSNSESKESSANGQRHTNGNTISSTSVSSTAVAQGEHFSRQRLTANKPTSNGYNNNNGKISPSNVSVNSRHSSTDADTENSDAYKERRRKNNEAAKRSRDSRRAKEDDIALRAAILERENLQLKVEVAQLKQETSKLRSMLYNS